MGCSGEPRLVDENWQRRWNVFVNSAFGAICLQHSDHFCQISGLWDQDTVDTYSSFVNSDRLVLLRIQIFFKMLFKSHLRKGLTRDKPQWWCYLKVSLRALVIPGKMINFWCSLISFWLTGLCCPRIYNTFFFLSVLNQEVHSCRDKNKKDFPRIQVLHNNPRKIWCQLFLSIVRGNTFEVACKLLSG